jgi:hypothetical protein
MPDPEQTPASRRQDPVRRLARRGVALAGPARHLGADAARAAASAASAAGRLVSEPQAGLDAGQAGIAGRQRYQIRVRGRLGQTICSAFPDLQARAEGGDTVLMGVLADQAALYGVLAEAEALGLELIEVRRLPPRDEPEAPSVMR